MAKQDGWLTDEPGGIGALEETQTQVVSGRSGRTVARPASAEFGVMHGVILCGGLGLFACFLPVVSVAPNVNADVSKSTIMAMVNTMPFVVLIPGGFIGVAVLSFVLSKNAVRFRFGIFALSACIGTVPTVLSLAIWGTLSQLFGVSGGQGSVGAGAVLPALLGAVAVILTLRQLFAESPQ